MAIADPLHRSQHLTHVGRLVEHCAPSAFSVRKLKIVILKERSHGLPLSSGPAYSSGHGQAAVNSLSRSGVQR